MDNDIEPKMAANPRYRYAIFTIVMTLFIDAIGFGIIIPLLPYYSQTFDAGSAALGILVASFALMQFWFSPYIVR